MNDNDDRPIGPNKARASRLDSDARMAEQMTGARSGEEKYESFAAVLREFLRGVLKGMNERGVLIERRLHIPRETLDLATDQTVREFMEECIVTGTWPAAEGVTIHEAVVRHGLVVLARDHGIAAPDSPSAPVVERVVEVLGATEPVVVALAILRAAGLARADETFGLPQSVVDGGVQRFWNRIAAARSASPDLTGGGSG